MRLSSDPDHQARSAETLARPGVGRGPGFDDETHDSLLLVRHHCRARPNPVQALFSNKVVLAGWFDFLRILTTLHHVECAKRLADCSVLFQLRRTHWWRSLGFLPSPVVCSEPCQRAARNLGSALLLPGLFSETVPGYWAGLCRTLCSVHADKRKGLLPRACVSNAVCRRGSFH